MLLHPPFEISARLMPAVRVGTAWISIGYHGASADGRTVYIVHIDRPDGEYTCTDLKSGAGGGGLQSGMESFLAFLGAAAEAYSAEMRGRTSDNADLFPPAIMEWAYQHSDELAMMQMDLEESPNLLEE